jgi:Holliday junction resolvase RusA-like endonuclease
MEDDFLHVTLPIYYTKSYKTKDDKTFLVNLNFARNAHYYLQNEVKQWYNEYIMKEIIDSDFKIKGSYEIAMVYYYKNILSDLDNICSQILKYGLDALQKAGVIVDDNIKYGKKISFYVGEQDKEHPRVEMYVKEFKD